MENWQGYSWRKLTDLTLCYRWFYQIFFKEVCADCTRTFGHLAIKVKAVSSIIKISKNKRVHIIWIKSYYKNISGIYSVERLPTWTSKTKEFIVFVGPSGWLFNLTLHVIAESWRHHRVLHLSMVCNDVAQRPWTSPWYSEHALYLCGCIDIWLSVWNCVNTAGRHQQTCSSM